MSTRPCPTCGIPITEQQRFCGQCGTTIGPAPAPATSLGIPVVNLNDDEPNVHEEVTVARSKPDLSQIKTIMDAAPYGAEVAKLIGAHKHASEAMRAAPPAASIPTPIVPAPETMGAPIVIAPVAPTGVPKTMIMSATMNDPDAEARARAMVDVAIASAATAQAAPVEAAAPKANFNKTMMLGGESPAVPGSIATPPQGGPAAPPAGDASPLSRSVLAPQSWLPQPNAAPPEPAPASPPAVDKSGPAGGAPALRTMIGMSAADFGFPQPIDGANPRANHPPANPPANPPPQTHGSTVQLGAVSPVAAGGGGGPPGALKTMLGVAIPGIAPSHAPAPPQQHGAPQHGAPQHGAPQHAPAGPMDLQSKQSTMLGVAIPGIAPSHAPAPPHSHGYGGQSGRGAYGAAPHIPSKVQNTVLGMMAAPDIKIVPRPMTLIDEPMPVAPQIPEKRGVPVLALVAIIFGLVLVGGGAIAFLVLRGAAPLVAVPQLDETGRESLKIGCATCPDGTTVVLGASSATLKDGAALLPLPAPLSIGDNDLTVKVERPAGGRREDVKIHVPVAYRVRADLSTLSAKPPAITVRIEATPGSVVTVEEKPVTLDGTGRGAYAIDLSKETEGSGEAKTFERKIPFAITPKGGKLESGELTARTGIVPLALDAPGRELVTDKGSAAVAGQTRAGSTVTIDGQSVPVDAQGRFGVRVELSAVGEKPLEIIASSPPLAPRIAKVKVTRVTSLDAAAKEQEAQSPVGYDVFGADPASKVGQKAIVEGEIAEARVTAGRTVLLVEEKKKCAKGTSCLVRIVHGDEDRVVRGDSVRVYGRVLGPVTAGGKTVPDIEAALVLPVKK